MQKVDVGISNCVLSAQPEFLLCLLISLFFSSMVVQVVEERTEKAESWNR